VNHSLTDTEKIKIHPAPSDICKATFITKPSILATIALVSSFVGTVVAVTLWDGAYKSTTDKELAAIKINAEQAKEKIKENENRIQNLEEMNKTVLAIYAMVKEIKEKQ
jgi:hypothetical protein